jgi:hypothetical protein
VVCRGHCIALLHRLIDGDVDSSADDSEPDSPLHLPAPPPLHNGSVQADFESAVLPDFHPGLARPTGAEPPEFQRLLLEGEGGPIAFIDRQLLRPVFYDPAHLNPGELLFTEAYADRMVLNEIITEIPIYDVRQADRVYLIPKAPGKAPRFIFAGLNINQRRGEPPHFTARTFQRLPSFLRKYEYLAVDDLTDAYSAYKLRDCDVTYFCFRVADRWFSFNRMPMGYNRSAWVLSKHLFYNLPYEDTSWHGDDIQHWGATHATCHATQTRNRAILANMGHNFNTSKAKPPKTEHDLLGLHVDLQNKTINFDKKKRRCARPALAVPPADGRLDHPRLPDRPGHR